MSGAGWRFAVTLIDELVRCGLTDVSIAPGSRSTPLALAFAEHGGARVHVHLDERSAAFFALGIAKATGRPTAVLCTSGTAAANFHPAVIEAFWARVPLLVLTADRPPELRDSGAGQTVDQVKLYGGAVRWYAEPGVARDEAKDTWRALANRAFAEALGRPSGPVHLNLSFDEPLVPGSADRAEGPVPGRPRDTPWTTIVTRQPPPAEEAAVEALTSLVEGKARGLLVAGWGAALKPAVADAFSAATRWPLLADPASGLRRGPSAISSYDALLRTPSFAASARPDVVVRVGAPLTSKVTNRWLDGCERTAMIDPDGAWLDPGRSATLRIGADPSSLLGAVAKRVAVGHERGWRAMWQTADCRAAEALDDLFDAGTAPTEPRTARDLVRLVPDGTTVFVGSSMPVRDVESFAGPREGLTFAVNRGANGIDGLVSTALGIAAASDGPVVALLGDLGFLHDASGLLGAGRRERGVVFVVVDNDGGGIFSFLPQASLDRHFETLFGTPHGLDLVAVAQSAGLPALRIDRAAALEPAVLAAIEQPGSTVIVVPSDRAANLRLHREATAAVAAAVDHQ